MRPRLLSVTNKRKPTKAVGNKRVSYELNPDPPKPRNVKKMFDKFFIIGAPTTFNETESESDGKEQQVSPVMLAAYSTATRNGSAEQDVDLITPFCFPTGFPKLPPTMSKNRTILNEFMFCISEDISTIYGICVIFQATTKSFFASKQNIEYPFCLCFLTQTPYLTSHFQFLTYLTLLLTGKVKSSPHISGGGALIPSSAQANIPRGLAKDDTRPSIAICEGIKAPKILVDELNFYYSLPTSPGQKIQPIRLTSRPNLTLSIPPQYSAEENFALASFHVLMSIFSIDDLIKIYTAMLCEEHVIFTSENLHRLSLSIIGIVSLLKPFEPIATMVLPLLPMDPKYQDFLESPCPYIVGVFTPYQDFEMLVNLDTSTIVEKVKTPRLPNEEKLKCNISRALASGGDFIKVPPKMIEQDGQRIKNPDHTKFFQNLSPLLFPFIFTSMSNVKCMPTPEICTEIIAAFQGHFPKILGQSIVECFMTDTTDIQNPITVFNKDLFMLSAEKCDHAFYEIFFQTQIWEIFCDVSVNAHAQETKSENMPSKSLVDMPNQLISYAKFKTMPNFRSLQASKKESC
ncbi:hypothetical protein TRFO_10499 [Tritrichomonas foetus]|uniref:UDENN domain-containing protein n=1 Tax=Tritrichomonas foetus TaxID=1144522 RepID=A0A1J4JDP0_9EUKA|nr:hypothetical protein TRFO_10499 [Tritrichomonas foetus]|eukprot:OHS95372.1 hypothetical protein TRFO_10499 [Tritrichomonas foetus]